VQPDRRRLEDLLWALEAFSLRGWIPLRYITTFLMVALDEGNYPSAYARRAGVDRMSMSRYLRDIGAESRSGGPGLGLVELVPDPDHPPRQRVLLTKKGRDLLLMATRPQRATEPDQKAHEPSDCRLTPSLGAAGATSE
jgi:hypothetical protein